ncbi:MAG TPA: GntR family transcriptional regulator [Candidatus Dormibacteraeota bacterium]|nr:GntR family transcriptional regulator [Candidatus Dormibacteraeota bacterium]
MAADFDANKPIYQQLMDRIISEIVRGDIKAGDKLTSVREYAVEVGVNVNTIQRVYRELEYLEIVATRRGQGTFVTENESLLQQLREDRKQKIIKQFVEEMKNMGYSLNDMIEGIKVEERNRK